MKLSVAALFLLCPLSLTQGANVATSNGTLATVVNVNAGNWFQTGPGTLEVNSGGSIVVTNASYETIVGQNAAGTSTINLNTGAVWDGSAASGNGTRFYLGNNLSTAIGVINVRGGTFNGSGFTDIIFGRDGGTGQMNISAGSVTLGDSTPSFDSVVSSGKTAGSNSYVNFTSGSTGTLAIAGATSSTYQAMWNAADLRFAGANNGTFADHFVVSGNVLGVAVAPPPASGPLELRFNTAASDWQSQALPVGNGAMGAMIYGSPSQDRMQFNEITLWTGGANLSGNYDTNTFGAYQNLGDLYLDNSGMGAIISNPSAAAHTFPDSTQMVDKTVDGTTAKWCLVHNNANVVWQAAYPSAVVITGYVFKSAGDVPERDPKTWVLQGSNDGSTWTQVDGRALGSATTPVWPFAARNTDYTFTCSNTTAYKSYRFVFTPNTSVPHFQVAEITMTGAPPSTVMVTNPSAASHTYPDAGQMVDKSVDGTNTKWCLIHNNANVIWQTAYPRPGTVTSYTIKSAEDVPQRDPKSWVLQGSNDAASWTTLDTRSLDATTTPAWPFAGRNANQTFTPAATGSYYYYRIVFTPYTGVPHFQVAEITLSGNLYTGPSGYSRVLDLTKALHTTTWTDGGVTHTRETLASHPHQILATRLTASAPGSLSLTLRMAGAHGEATTSSGNEIGFTGTLANNGLRYASKARVIATGGTLTATGGNLVAANCDSLVIYHAAATDYAMDSTTTPAFRSGVDPSLTVTSRLNAAQAAGYDAVKLAHLADYQSLFNRASLDLGAPPAQTLTPSRLAAYKAGGADPNLEALLFHYGRYLLISSSRDSLPANLQGLWNNSNSPDWSSDYHVNINLQMNYWAAEPVNLSACHTPLFNYLGAIAPLSRSATKASFGSTTPGWTMRTSTNPFGGHGWNWDTPSSAWLARHYWDHYLYSGDTAFLQNTAWPVMKEICQFWISRLKDNGAGKLVTPQGWSPEHGPVEDGVSYVQEIVWELFTNTIAAQQVLGNDPTFAAQLTDLRSRLLVPAIGPQGQITEWATPATEAANGYGTGNHRHTSHLYAIYPGHQFNPVDTPDYIAAGKLSLADRGTSGDSRQSWTWPWRTALWARMNEGEKAHDMLRGLLTYNTFDNLFLYCQPAIFQIDGSLGMPAAMTEMLLQGQGGQIVLLPALPSAWPTGSFTGLRAPGGFEVDATWQNGAVTSTNIRSTAGQPLTFRSPALSASPGAFVRSGTTVRSVTRHGSTITLPTTAGASYGIDTYVTSTADADGDGMTTWQEWLAGTDPNRTDSSLKVTMIQENGVMKATWPEIAERHYQLQISTDLQNWTLVTEHDSPTDRTFAQTVSTQTANRFYRVVVSLPPSP